jgi:hypothetical protein
MKDDDASLNQDCNCPENDYDQNQITAYVRLLQSLSELGHIAIKCYRDSGTYYGGSNDQQTERAYALIEIMKEANQKIALFLPTDHKLSEGSADDEDCPNGYYRCRGQCIQIGLPCP